MIGKDGTRAFDKWSYVHAIAGVIMSAAEISRPAAYALTIGTELVEFVARRRQIEFFNESDANVATDLALTLGAYEISTALRRLRS